MKALFFYNIIIGNVKFYVFDKREKKYLFSFCAR